ncbi:TerB family tellurite resistance protein [Flavobacterium sp. RSB2_4_14]|uniref:TerB family tellurite resistance protein n=1 Tax=Flavobacterium sp. RSB2_4_14 TaxID=3447665 RepID=UPI003F388338
MKTEAFQNLLLKSAVSVIACDGSIEESEISEIRNMAENEIYFMGYDFEEPLANNLKYLKENGASAINEYLKEVSNANLNDNQELLLIEVLIRAIESDKKVEPNEIKFLQMVKSKLKTSEETIITQFPKQMNYLIDFHNYGLHEEFTDELKFE